MGRSLSLFSLLFVALGLFALSSVARAESQPSLPEGPPAPPSGNPSTKVLNSPRYHVQFSLN